MSSISLSIDTELPEHEDEEPLAKRQCQRILMPPDNIAVPTTPSSNVAANTVVTPTNLDDVAKLLMVNMQSKDSKVVYRAFEESAMGCMCDRKDHELALEYGAIGIILNTMQKWHHHDGIQQMSHQIFCDILQEFPRTTAGLFIKLGGVEAILSAMNTHMDEYGTLFNGIHALNALFKVLKEDQQQEILQLVVAKRFVEEMNGISTVINALKRRQDEDDVWYDYEDDMRYTHGCISLLLRLYELYQRGSRKILRKWKGSAALVAQAIEDYRDDDDEYDHEDITVIVEEIQRKGMQVLGIILAQE